MIGRRQLLLGLAAAGAATQAAASVHPERGDLNGFWTSLSGTPLERPARFKALTITEAEARAYEQGARDVIHGIPGDDVGQDKAEWFAPDPPLTRIRGEARTSFIVDPPDGRLPYSPAGRTALVANLRTMEDFDGPEGRPPPERCLIGFGAPAGAPMLPTPQTTCAYQFVQTRDHLVIRAETNHDLRIVSLGDVPPPPGTMRPWMGVSQGRWQGDTLVVQTSRFNPAEAIRSLPYQLYLSPAANVTEQFTRISAREVLYAFTIDDPAAFTRPWRGELVFQATALPIYEYACHEGNYSLENILAGARRIEGQRRAAQ